MRDGLALHAEQVLAARPPVPAGPRGSPRSPGSPGSARARRRAGEGRRGGPGGLLASGAPPAPNVPTLGARAGQAVRARGRSERGRGAAQGAWRPAGLGARAPGLTSPPVRRPRPRPRPARVVPPLAERLPPRPAGSRGFGEGGASHPQGEARAPTSPPPPCPNAPSPALPALPVRADSGGTGLISGPRAPLVLHQP